MILLVNNKRISDDLICEKIIKQGQKEGSVVSGNSRKLSELYWGVVYLYAVKNMYQTDFAMINSDDLSRLLLGDK